MDESRDSGEMLSLLFWIDPRLMSAMLALFIIHHVRLHVFGCAFMLPFQTLHLIPYYIYMFVFVFV